MRMIRFWLAALAALSVAFAPLAQAQPQRRQLLEYPSIHHPVVGTRGMVVSQNALATEVGAEILRKGGEQFDIDFVRARRKILSNLLGESTVTGELASRLSFMSTFELPANYYNTLLQQVAAVSPAQVRALIAKELDANNEVIVLLGAKPQLDKAFGDAGIKDVKLVEPEYK